MIRNPFFPRLTWLRRVLGLTPNARCGECNALLKPRFLRSPIHPRPLCYEDNEAWERERGGTFDGPKLA
jgi:hypothetical protein